MRGGWLFALALALGLAAHGRDRVDDWIDATRLPSLSLETSVEVLDRDGRLLRAYTVGEGRWRLAVEPGAVDPGYVEILLAYEDRRFRTHPGIDLRAMARAAWQAATSGRVISGGSTLTMQVARLLEDSGTGRVAGKIRQMRVALALERRLSKEAILGLYFQLAPYGGNLEGIRAATLAYFGKEPRRLTPSEAAMLVAIPQAPEGRRPDRNPEALRIARDRVLARMVRDGVISADRAAAARTEPVPSGRRDFPALAPHLADRVLAEAPGAAVHRLTLDASVQARLESLAREALQGQGERLQIAIVAADHRSGEILASVGSAAYESDARQGFNDMARALRSPGSTLKPLIYGIAFDRNLVHPETLIEDRPVAFGGYVPRNFDRLYRGTVRVRDALILSLNTPAVQLVDAFGTARLVAVLRRAGVEPVVPNDAPGLAVALGGVGLTLTDLVQVYGAIARGGVSLPLHYADTTEEGARIMGAVAAWQVADILSGMPPPPGAPANRLAYKTGTSYGFRDAWAVGFDGRHVIGVWMGRADGTPVPGAFGAEQAAPVLFQAFARLKPELDPLPAPPAAALTVATADLPQALRHFRSRGVGATDGPSVAFPPDGAEVERLGDRVLARVQGGSAPFSWLADGVPLVVGARAREVLLPMAGAGFVTLSVIDAEGRSARVQLRLR